MILICGFAISCSNAVVVRSMRRKILRPVYGPGRTSLDWLTSGRVGLNVIVSCSRKVSKMMRRALRDRYPCVVLILLGDI
jgi:hypothetical protein